MAVVAVKGDTSLFLEAPSFFMIKMEYYNTNYQEQNMSLHVIETAGPV